MNFTFIYSFEFLCTLCIIAVTLLYNLFFILVHFNIEMIDIHAVSGNVSEAMNKAWKIVFVMILVLGAICALIILIIKLCWGLFLILLC